MISTSITKLPQIEQFILQNFVKNNYSISVGIHINTFSSSFPTKYHPDEIEKAFHSLVAQGYLVSRDSNQNYFFTKEGQYTAYNFFPKEPPKDLPLSPEPPTTLKKFLWIKQNWRQYWLLLLIAVVLFCLSLILDISLYQRKYI